MLSMIQRTVNTVAALVTGRQRHKYQTVQVDIDEGQETDFQDSEQRRRRSRIRRAIIIAVSILGITLFVYWVVVSERSERGNKSCDHVNDGYQCKYEISRFWGQYSPYFSVPSEISGEVPDQCQITFAQILSRHGARDPTALKSDKYRETIKYIHEHARRYPGKTSFLKKYKYALGKDQLTAFGEQELVNSGLKYYTRYQALAKDTTPFIRASGQERVINSAQKWAEGFHTAHLADKNSIESEHYPYKILVINEGGIFNNTLSHRTCSDYNTSTANNVQETWASIFTKPITRRLSKIIKAKLSTEQTICLMDLCPYETVANTQGHISYFCSMFAPEEWKSYDYYQSLGKYYGYGWGNLLGATQGVGFANELIARMTNSPVEDHTNTNSTLDGSEQTFPIGGKTSLYADFSHDNDMTSIFAALGMYNATQPPSETTIATPQEMDGYSASWTVPFAARAYFEKMRCAGQDEEYVRVVVNDRVLPLKTCGGDKLGRCTLSKFVDSLSFARGGGDWDKCFV